jgi:Niemann-Pick C1 protein
VWIVLQPVWLATGTYCVMLYASFSHSLQDSSVPLAERVASALSSVGPSITLAASAEVLAFGLGALSPMPAVRNFSVCAAVAIALDFVLQVRG